MFMIQKKKNNENNESLIKTSLGFPSALIFRLRIA